MDQQPIQHGLRRDRGFVTAQWLVMAGLSMIMLLAAGNALLWHYTRAAVTAAADEAARAASVRGAEPGECESAAFAVINPADGLLRGRFADAVDRVHCSSDGSMVTVEITGVLPWLFPGILGIDAGIGFRITSRAVMEREP